MINLLDFIMCAIISGVITICFLIAEKRSFQKIDDNLGAFIALIIWALFTALLLIVII